MIKYMNGKTEAKQISMEKDMTTISTGTSTSIGKTTWKKTCRAALQYFKYNNELEMYMPSSENE